MWTEITRPQYQRGGLRYASDTTDGEWAVIAALMPPPHMDESTGILPGLPAVAGKPVHVAFDGGRLTSDAGILLLAAIEQRLGIAERLADCSDDRSVLRQLRADPPAHRARHRRHRGPGSRRSATRAVQRLLRQPLLPADPHLRSDHRQAGGDHPAPRQDTGRR